MQIQARLTKLNENEILMYLGYRGQEYTEDVREQMGRCEKEVLKTAVPRLVWRRFSIEDANFTALSLQGNDIWELLDGCKEAVLMAVTLGPEIDALLRKKSITDMADAVIMDACADTAIENVADHFEADLRKELKAEHLFLTDRFSPGYGDLPLSTQKKLCAVLDAERKIGLSLSPTFLMIPKKSVTAILGISDEEKPLRKRGCEVCARFQNCTYRKEGKHCNAK